MPRTIAPNAPVHLFPQSHTKRTYLGFDNGVSGSLGIVPYTAINAQFYHAPVFSQLNYQKEAKNVTRIDGVALHAILAPVENGFAILERPLVNPAMFSATLSAVRAMEATLVILETLRIPYIFIDSKEWQKAMLPEGVKGDALKTASHDVGCRLFPEFRSMFQKQGDADGILIAEYARRSNL